MIVAVHQPQFLPWAGYFHKMDSADVFCYLDNVQFKKNEWQNRNRLKTAAGPQWITVPVTYRFPQKINEVRISQQTDWPRKHLQMLISHYGSSPYFKQYFPVFEKIYDNPRPSFSELTIRMIEELKKLLALRNTESRKASDMELREDPTGRLVDICLGLGADTYLSGRDGANYMDMQQFADNGIRVLFQEFIHPVYPQLFGEFQSHLSIADMLFNCGPETMKRIRAVNP